MLFAYPRRKNTFLSSTFGRIRSRSDFVRTVPTRLWARNLNASCPRLDTSTTPRPTASSSSSSDGFSETRAGLNSRSRIVRKDGLVFLLDLRSRLSLVEDRFACSGFLDGRQREFR